MFTLAFVQLVIASEHNMLQRESIFETIALLFSNFSVDYIFISPFIGAFGSFVTGSATVSNLIFGSLQYNLATVNNISTSLILALQSSGAAFGNMIAIHNVIALLALLKLKNQESKIIKNNLKVCLLFCLIASFIGFIIYFLI